MPTLRYGLQLLIDTSDAMTPYARDAGVLAKRVDLIVGRGRVETLFFSGLPLRGVTRDPAHPSYAYAPPAPRTPVLLLTDLGIQRQPLNVDCATSSEWHQFAAQVRQAQCPLIAFVPYPRSRWPHALQPAFALVPWDRTTTVSVAKRAVARRPASHVP